MVMTMGVVLQMSDNMILAMWGGIMMMLGAISFGIWMGVWSRRR